MNRKIVVTLICLFFVVFIAQPSILGADNDTFTVSASGAYLECIIINATWAIGTVAMDANYFTNATAETILADTSNSTSGTNLDFEMTISAEATDWATVWVDNMTTGADLYKLNASDDGFATNVSLNTSVYIDVSTSFAPATNVTFDLHLASPQSTITGATQTITTTGKVTVA